MATNPEVLSPEESKSAALAESGNRMSDILAAQARANVQAHYLIAQSKPRDWDVVRTKLLALCDRPAFAAEAVKVKPGIAEPMLTIRFAEAAQQIMGNLEPTRAIIYESDTQRIVRMGLSDLESNNHPTRDLVIEKVVERKNKQGRNVISHRSNSKGEIVYLVEATEDEMFTKESAWGSKWERQLTLKHLPADIRYECYSRCLETQRKADKADPQAAKNKLIDAYNTLGVRPDQLKEFLDVQSLDNLQPKDIELLRQIYTAIKEEDTNWREVMDARNAARGTGTQGAANADTSTAAGKAKEAAKKAAGKVGAADPTQTATKQETTTAPSTSASAPNNAAPTTEPAKTAPAADSNDDW